jgi:probable F420-dependent oxidoreductase
VTDNKNAVGNDRKYWGMVAPMPAPFLVEAARHAEARNLEAIGAAQVYGPPFIPLAAAAAVTERIKLVTTIAIAAARSPFETAMAALDMDRLSSGRFVLGLGSSVSAWTKGNFGAPDLKPLAHLRETVAAVRHIIKGAHVGLEPFEGEYFKADFKQMSPIDPPVRDEIPILIAALREKMTRLGAEVGDYISGHPMWSVDWATQKMGPAILDELAKHGRKRTDIEVNLCPWVLPNPNEKEALDDARPTIAFYAGAEQYEAFFEAHGFRDEARACQAGIQQGDYLSITQSVPDEMVKAFVAMGEPAKVRESVEPLWKYADSISPFPTFYNMPPEKMFYYQQQIEETFKPE